MHTVQWVWRIYSITGQYGSLCINRGKEYSSSSTWKWEKVNMSFCSNSSFATGLCNQYVKTLRLTFCSNFPICEMCWETQKGKAVWMLGHYCCCSLCWGETIFLSFCVSQALNSPLWEFQVEGWMNHCLQVKLIQDFMVFKGYGICTYCAPMTPLPKALTVHSYGVRCEQIVEHSCFSCSFLKH